MYLFMYLHFLFSNLLEKMQYYFNCSDIFDGKRTYTIWSAFNLRIRTLYFIQFVFNPISVKMVQNLSVQLEYI